jgi:DNA primase
VTDDFKEWKERVRHHSDIVDVISRYVPLKRAGSIFKACCPFHKEKTPSFTVNPARQGFHCFGCQSSGDVFRFVEQYENLSFIEAANILAERAGIPPHDPREGGDDKQKEEFKFKQVLYAMHEKLAVLYHETLTRTAEAAAARAYLADRDLQEAVSTFQIGLAPARPGVVSEWARREGFSAKLMEAAGVLLPGRHGGAPYDRFKGRLMFPIRDERDRVVAFSGRILDQSSPAKYLNSPETRLFQKGMVLYGLDRARRTMSDERRAIVCEGQIDTIRCHLAGFDTAVAPQGTALTAAHVHLLKRFADEVILVFDADTAGQNAALRGAALLLAEGVSVRIAALPVGEDPDTLIRNRGAAAFGDYLEQALSIAGFYLAVHRERGDLDTQAGVFRAAQSLLEIIQHAPSAVQQEAYIREAAPLLATTEAALREDLQKLKGRTPHRAVEIVAHSPNTPEQPKSYPPNQAALLELMIAHPEVLDLVSRYVPPKAMTDPHCQAIAKAILTLPELDSSELMAALDDEDADCRTFASRLLMTARSIESDEVSSVSAAQDIIIKLHIGLIEKKIQACKQQEAELATDNEKRPFVNEAAQLMLVKKSLQKGWESAIHILEHDL